MPFCLPFKEANKLKEAIRKGRLSPAKLNKMTSQERRDFLTDIIGSKNAKEVNLLFEQKLLLKNQERAMSDWARGLLGLSTEQRAATLEKIRQTYADKKRRLEDPKENEVFLNEIVSDIYSKKFKTEITLKEAQTITELSQDLKRAREKIEEKSGKFEDSFSYKEKSDKNTMGIDFGAATSARNNYIGGLKAEANKELFVNPFRIRGLMEKARAVHIDAKISLEFIAQNSRAMRASWDNSLWGRQGIKVIYTKPTIWAKNFGKSWVDIYQVLRRGNKAGDAIIDAVKAEIYSRENYIRGRYERGEKLDIGIVEEEFPTSFPSKIPVFGRFFRAAEVSYEAGAMRLRVDLADKMYDMMEKNGIDMENKIEIGGMNLLVNSMTGRGKLPWGLEKAAKSINIAFFSIKFLKSNVDTLTAPLHLLTGEVTFAKKQAAINLLKIVSSIAVILMINDALDNDSVEWDPTSANFCKIKKGNIRFDVSGGMCSLVILGARLATGSTKSSVTGVVTEFGETYGSPDAMDAIWNFTENKFSPLFSTFKELINQKTFEGEKPTIIDQLTNLTVPIVIESGVDAYYKEDIANALMVLIADGLGISANVYSYNVNWDMNPGKELMQFKEKIGEKKFKEANKEYIRLVNEKILELKNDQEWIEMDDEDKRSKLTSEKSKIKKKIFKSYKFKYKRSKK